MVLYSVLLIVEFFITSQKAYLFTVLIVLLSAYAALFLYTLLVMIAEGKRLGLKWHRWLAALFINPVFVTTYLPIFVRAMFTKEVEWKPIEHTVTMKNEEQK